MEKIWGPMQGTRCKFFKRWYLSRISCLWSNCNYKKEKQPISLYSHIYSTESKEFKSMNGETLKSIEYIKSIIEKKCTFVCDRGYDANIYYEYFLKEECNDDFIIRLTEKRKLMFKGKSKKASEIAVKRKGKIKMNMYFPNWMRSKNFFVRC